MSREWEGNKMDEEMIEVLQFNFTDFYEDNGLYVAGRSSTADRLPSIRERIYLTRFWTAFQRDNNSVFTTRFNYDRLKKEAMLQSPLITFNIPQPKSTQMAPKDMYKALVELYPYEEE
jgi:hypothetical protein